MQSTECDFKFISYLNYLKITWPRAHTSDDPTVLGRRRAVALAANIVTAEGTINITICRRIEVTTIYFTTTSRYVKELNCSSHNFQI